MTVLMRRQIRYSLIFLGLFTVLTGLFYPLAVTGIAQVFFNHQANGSMIVENAKNIGSELIGQPVNNPRYFWGRLSATASFPYNSASSSGSNFSQANPALREAIRARMIALRAADPDNQEPIPVDLVTSSGSGLDPHISVAAALYQIPRVAQHRALDRSRVKTLVDQYTEEPQFGFLGERRVNVLLLNLSLDTIK
jgi:K+-transporting ATPase ATPase C chain